MKKIRHWLLGLAISLAALVVAFWGLQLERLVDVVNRAQPWFLVPAVMVLVLGLFARARAWHLLLGERPSFRRAFWALNEGYLLNSVLPFRIGELGRAYSVSRQSTVSTLSALSAVVVERLIDIAVTLAALIVALSAIAAPAWAGDLALGGAVVLGVGILTAFLIVMSRERLLTVVARMPGAEFLGLPRRVDSFAAGLGEAAGLGRLSQATLWNLAAWATVWIQMALLFRMFDLQGNLLVYMFVTGVTAFGAALPSSPGALGVYELSMLAAMRVVGYGQADGVGLAVTAHVLQLSVTGLLGAVALSQEGETILSLARRAQKVFEEAQEGTPA